MSASAITLAFPSTQDVTHVVRNTYTDPSRFRGMEVLPDAAEFVTDIQVDVIDGVRGIAGPRALGGQFNQAVLTGNTLRKYATAYWGDTYVINEKELLEARQEGTYNQRAGYLRVLRRANELNIRLDTLVEYLRWAAVVDGKVAVNSDATQFEVKYDIPSQNVIEDLDMSDAKFDVVGWISTIQGKFRGTGAKASKIWYNLEIGQQLAQSTVLRDLLKRSNDATAMTPENMSTIMKKFFPSLDFEMYDEGYKAENGEYTPFIAADKYVVIGKGHEKLGDFCSTLAVQNGGIEQPQPGKFSLIENKTDQDVPFIKVTVGVNGLPRLHHPEWIMRGSVLLPSSAPASA
ncbi:major capsid protein [Tumebacillus flagellatus]|uniref:Major capsid protein n=1 Tax=Tumebacillus flagellatus TaxID=1157490 RepID=A0A074LFM2_9BACL|nr:minor capsid protein E [Tumebacillus flagellatus]KEO81041.1 hypothetical protein EL26_22950 [Tumebacillus flagellatus]